MVRKHWFKTMVSGALLSGYVLSGNINVLADGDGVAINETNFPSEFFRDYLSEMVDTSRDGYLSSSEISATTAIELGPHSHENDTSLKGIEYFTALEEFSLGDWGGVTAIDFSHNTKLERLYISNCPGVTAVDLSKNMELKELVVWRCSGITAIDLTKNTKLERLDINDCSGITVIDPTKNTKLEWLLVQDCPGITSLDLSHNKELRALYCGYNSLTSLNLSENKELMDLGFGGNDIKELNISNNVHLLHAYNYGTTNENEDSVTYYSSEGSFTVDKSVKIIADSNGTLDPTPDPDPTPTEPDPTPVSDLTPHLEKDANGNLVCYVNGQQDNSYSGYADYSGSKFFVTNGKIDTTISGVKIDGSAEPLVWYFCSNGQVQTQHVGLALYDGEWFYVENGKVAVEMNKFVEYNGGLFAVAAGRIVGEYSGLMQDPENPVDGDWYFFANGQAQTQYTGLAMYDNAWFYVVNGKLAVDYTGPVDYDGATFHVENGMVK